MIAAELGPVDQLGFVVTSLERALPCFQAVYGDFQVFSSKLEGALYRGTRTDCELEIALGHSGALEIELIEVVSGDSIHREFTAKGREGPHHIRYRVEDLEASVKELTERGLESVWSHEMFGYAWAYLEGDAGMLIELLQAPS